MFQTIVLNKHLLLIINFLQLTFHFVFWKAILLR